MNNKSNFLAKLVTTAGLTFSLVASGGLPSYGNDLEQIFSGQNIPVTLKFRDLNTNWRKVSVSGQFEMGDLLRSWTSFLDSILGTKTYTNVYYSQGKTITIGNNIYLIAYRIPLKFEPLNIGNILSGGLGNKNCGEGQFPMRLTPDTQVSLALLNLNSAGSFNDLVTLDVNAEIAESEKKYQNAVMICEQSRINDLNQQGKESIGVINRSQQAYYVEYGKFTDSWQDLGLDWEKETDSYSYSISVSNNAVISQATAKNKELHSYVGGVFYVSESSGFVTITCQSEQPTNQKLANPMLKDNQAICGVNTNQVD